jgi:hypothetical protein
MLDWTGLSVFLAALLVTVGALIVAGKPPVVAPIAARFGRVSKR